MGGKSSHMNRRRSVSFAESPKNVGACEGPRSVRSFPPLKNSRKGFLIVISVVSLSLSLLISFVVFFFVAEVLLEAARTGNLKILSSILDSCPHLIEIRDTVLFLPSPLLSFFIFLIRTISPLPFLCEKRGRTPLYQASCKGHLGAVQLLLARSANPDIPKEVFPSFSLFIFTCVLFFFQLTLLYIYTTTYWDYCLLLLLL